MVRSVILNKIIINMSMNNTETICHVFNIHEHNGVSRNFFISYISHYKKTIDKNCKRGIKKISLYILTNNSHLVINFDYGNSVSF